MIRDMIWIPSDCPATGATALMWARFNEAIAAYCLQGEVQAAVQRRHAAPVLPLDSQDTAGQEDVKIMSHSSTEVIDSDQEEHWNTVE